MCLKSTLHAAMAQLVEQLNRNQQVGGSSPSCSTMKVSSEPTRFVFLIIFISDFNKGYINIPKNCSI